MHALAVLDDKAARNVARLGVNCFGTLKLLKNMTRCWDSNDRSVLGIP
jgi:predicted nucleic acid-binding protein